MWISKDNLISGLVSMFFCVVVFVCVGGEARGETDILKYYWVDTKVFSYVPGDVIESYKEGNGSGGGVRATLGHYFHDEVRYFGVTVMGMEKEGIFFARVTVESHDDVTESREFDVDLSDMAPKKLEMAWNEDGRVYVVRLVPSVKIVDNRPKRLKVSDFKIRPMNLCQTIVIVDDMYYVGSMGVAGGELAWIEISGVGMVEFTLKPFRGAKRLGKLKDEKIEIVGEDGTRIDIYGVKTDAWKLGSGPWEVWVRWSDASVVEALPDEATYMAMSKKRVEEELGSDWDEQLQERVHELYVKEKKKEEAGIRVLSSGMGPIRPVDRLE